MLIREYEDYIKNTITDVVNSIIRNNRNLNIVARSRAGAEISDWLETQFVASTQGHPLILDSEGAPKGKTKNPWDAKCNFNFNDHLEEIWIDFKAFKLSSIDSNPDMGTPNKIINFIASGGFYLLYIHVYYEEFGNGLQFVEYQGNLVKSYFLKDISSTFRRTPTNQLQVNISALPEYRTREEFIELLMNKVGAGLQRQLLNAQRKLLIHDRIAEDLKERNRISQAIIEQKIQ